MADRLSSDAPFDGGYLNGGVGVVPRRIQDPILSGLSDAAVQIGLPGFGMSDTGSEYIPDPRYRVLSYLAQNVPLRLLRKLLAQDGTAMMAAGMEASLAYGARNVRAVAIKDFQSGRGTIDNDGTAELERIYSLYDSGDLRASIGEPAKIAGINYSPSSPIPSALPMLLHATDRINDTGQALFEATGDIGIGVTGIYDFDALDCRYRDVEIEIADGRVRGGARKKRFRVFEQENKNAKATDALGAVDGWRILNSDGIASVTWRGSTNNPYGAPRNGASLPYLLRKVSRRRDFADWFHGSALPKVIIEQLVDSLLDNAGKHPDICKDLEGNKISPTAWVNLQQELMTEKFMSMSSDRYIYMGQGRVYPVNPSNISGVTDWLQMERIEEIQALNILPALVGVTQGGTQAYSVVEWLAQTEALNQLSAYSSAPLKKIGDYHFRLLGENLIVQIEFDKLPPIDPDKAATARKTEIENETTLAAAGVNSADYFARRVSGSGAVDKKKVEEYLSKMREKLITVGNGTGTQTK